MDMYRTTECKDGNASHPFCQLKQHSSQHTMTTYKRCRMKRLPNFKQLLNDLIDAYPYSRKAPIIWASKLVTAEGHTRYFGLARGSDVEK
jgi:hypothetical protein